MKLFLIACAAVVMMHLPIPLEAFAECKCTGSSQDYIYQGGDKRPLTWYSLQRLDQDSDNRSGRPPIYCYERKVRNYSDQEVADVYWPVAGYVKKLLPPWPADCCCDAVAIPDILKQDHPSGPLHYGPGSTSQYTTTTYAPRGGWPGFSAQLTPLKQMANQPPLISTLQIAIRTPQDKIVVSNIRLQSQIISLPGMNSYQYGFYNDGPEPLFVYWNIPQTNQFRMQFAMDIKNPVILPPGRQIIRAVESSEYAAWVGATVVIFDRDRKVIARGMAAVYGFAKGEILRDPLMDWRILEQR